ncbi:MAG: MOSC domain-containing protein [Oscillatoriales cyanobacterium]|nr:MAG: MOSC domain-containing protein [Oscillatoriales cyanobacterium]
MQPGSQSVGVALGVRLARITIFPIKSLDGVSVDRVRLTAAGALAGDREFALLDAQGNWLNGKRNAAIHRIRSTFDLDQRSVTLWVQDDAIAPATFALDGDRTDLAAWFSDYFRQPITIIQNVALGFPDDPKSWGPTLIGTATLNTVAHWFEGMSAAELSRRLRTNLDLDVPEPFWEEQLYSLANQPVPFRIGAVELLGTNPCQRCIVPTRHSQTGESLPQFQKTFIAHRQASLPTWAERSRFNHFYRLAINTQIPPIADDRAGDRWLALGDPLTLAHYPVV